MPIVNPFVIVGITEDGVRHFINVQTSDVGPVKMFFRMLCYRCRPSFYRRYGLGITMERLDRI